MRILTHTVTAREQLLYRNWIVCYLFVMYIKFLHLSKVLKVTNVQYARLVQTYFSPHSLPHSHLVISKYWYTVFLWTSSIVCLNQLWVWLTADRTCMTLAGSTIWWWNDVNLAFDLTYTVICQDILLNYPAPLLVISCLRYHFHCVLDKTVCDSFSMFALKRIFLDVNLVETAFHSKTPSKVVTFKMYVAFISTEALSIWAIFTIVHAHINTFKINALVVFSYCNSFSISYSEFNNMKNKFDCTSFFVTMFDLSPRLPLSDKREWSVCPICDVFVILP